MSASLEELEAIDGIGPKMAAEWVSIASKIDFKQEIKQFYESRINAEFVKTVQNQGYYKIGVFYLQH